MDPFDHLHSHAHHVVALFPRQSDAEVALEELRSRGLPEKQFSMLVRHDDETPPTEAEEEKVRDVAAGIGVGGAVGLVAGALAFGIPGIGTVIGAGLWTATAVGAALGASAGIEISDYHHAWEGPYRSGVADGLVLAAVSTDDPLVAADAVRTFKNHSPERVDHFDRNGTSMQP